MTDAQQAQGFMYDFYAILDVPDSASEVEIVRAFQAKQKEWHPDRYAQLAAESQARATQMSAVLSQAYATLSDPTQRADYDQQLQNWSGPVSRNGIPIVDLRQAGWLRLDDDKWQELCLKIEQRSGFDQTTFDLLQAQYQLNPGDKKVARAYTTMLSRKLVIAATQENILVDSLGITGYQGLVALESHVGRLEGLLHQRRDQLLALAGSQNDLMLAAGQLTDLPSSDRLEVVTSQFDVTSQRALAAAQQHFDLVEVLVGLSHVYSYEPDQPERYRTLLLHLEESDFWLVAELQEDGQVDNYQPSPEQRDELLERSSLDQADADQGVNVLYVEPLWEVNPMLQLEAAIRWHFNPIIAAV